MDKHIYISSYIISYNVIQNGIEFTKYQILYNKHNFKNNT